jgi:hypothetical protein
MPGDVRIDASGVQRIDGAGLTALAIARRRCLEDGRSFALTSIAPEAVKGLRVADRLTELFGARPSSAATDAIARGEQRATREETGDGRPHQSAPPRRLRFHRLALHRHHGM